MRTVNEWLFSEETGVPFSHCIHCRFPLLELDVPWLINKEYLGGECILEYAICQPCRDVVSARFSEESKAAVRHFLEKEIDWEARVADFMMSHEPVERLNACVACRTPRNETEGFSISALCDAGGKLVIGPLPLLICRDCVSRMTASFSEASREVWNRFLAEHFAGPPNEGGFPSVF
jgi:hypothetical protein